MNFDFVLIDLYSQRQAVNRYVEGWSKEDILAWMGQYGLVTFLPHLKHESWEHYTLTPACCSSLVSAFYFSAEAELIIPHVERIRTKR